MHKTVGTGKKINWIEVLTVEVIFKNALYSNNQKNLDFLLGNIFTLLPGVTYA